MASPLNIASGIAGWYASITEFHVTGTPSSVTIGARVDGARLTSWTGQDKAALAGVCTGDGCHHPDEDNSQTHW